MQPPTPVKKVLKSDALSYLSGLAGSMIFKNPDYHPPRYYLLMGSQL